MYEIRAEKNKLREKYKAIRDALSTDEKSILDTKICKRVISTVSFRFSQTVLLYSPIKSEVDITSIALAALKAGKNVAYPRCGSNDGKMTFHYVTSLDELKPGSFGILEPTIEAPLFFKESVPKKEDAICLIPALIYDKDGYRLGYGKGYYDRFLSDFCGIKAGIIYSSCIADRVPRGKYDLKVDFTVSEKGVMLTNEN